MQRRLLAMSDQKLSVAELLTELPFCIKVPVLLAGKSGLPYLALQSAGQQRTTFRFAFNADCRLRSNLGVALLPRFAIQHDLDVAIW